MVFRTKESLERFGVFLPEEVVTICFVLHMSFVDFKVLINKALSSWLGKWGKSSVDPGPGDERQLPFHDPESSSASPATLQVN